MGAMKCPLCGATNTLVVDSRPLEGGSLRKRRFECRDCKERFNTIEVTQGAYEELVAAGKEPSGVEEEQPREEKGGEGQEQGQGQGQEQPREEKTVEGQGQGQTAVQATCRSWRW